MKPLNINNWAYAYGGPEVKGLIRATADDFIVDEQLVRMPEGTGEHVYLFIEKRHQNTQWLVRRLAELAGVKQFAVGYAGLKDRHALTRQWFSVHLPGASEPDWQDLEDRQTKVLQVSRHRKKLKPGHLRANFFNIVVKGLQGADDALMQHCARIQKEGVPNYFGEQRFGIDGHNIGQAFAMFNGDIKPKRSLRAIYLSAARSLLFNKVLDFRLQQGSWQNVLEGDVLMLAGCRSVFSSTGEDSAALQKRVENKELRITGPLYGEGESLAQSTTMMLEAEVMDEFSALTAGLKRCRLQTGRRALSVLPKQLEWSMDADVLKISFELPAGSYATSLLREIVNYESVAH